MFYRALLIAGICMCTGACASQSAQTVNQTIAATEVALTAADTAAKLYTSLPRCGLPTSPPICSDPALVTKILSASQKAYTAVKQAENNEGTIDAALTALSSLQSLIPTIGSVPK